MGEDFVKQTQTKLGKIIDKPPLTEKLLKKPPFRYLHDIITEIIKKSSFMKGLFNDSEMDSKNFKDKDSKIAFLQKIVEVAVMVTGQSLTVRPSKIVAGHEPEKTNELLQAIATAVLNKMDSTEAVRKVLNGEKPGSSKPPKPHKDEEKSKDKHSVDKHKRDKENREKKTSSNRERSSSREKEKEKHKDRSKDRDKNRDRSKDREREKDKSQDRSKDREREKDKSQDRSKDREREKDKSRDKERSKDKDKERTRDKDKLREKDKQREKDRSKDRSKDKEKKEGEKEKDKEKEKDRERRERRKRKEGEEAKRKEEEAKRKQEEDEQPLQNGNQEDEEDMRPPSQEDDGSSSNRIQRPSSAKGQRRRPTKDMDDFDGQKTDGAIQRNQQEAMMNGDDTLPPQVATSRRMARPSSARPAPPKVKKQETLDDPGKRVGSGKQVASVIVDNGNSDEEDDTFMVQETEPLAEDDTLPVGRESIEDDCEHGGLVKKILETKKELEGSNKIQNKEETPVVMDAAKRKERQLIQREVEKLRGSIQTLTRSANPLGKIMDYLQEDVDSMQKELEMWKKENQEHALSIKREQGITNSELEPLQAQLSELDQASADQLDAIAAVKCNIIRNDEKTNKMLSSVAFSR